jgi:cytochrome c553
LQASLRATCIAQLINFREGRRTNTAMAHLIGPLSDAYLQEIGAYFAALDLPYPPPQTVGADAALLSRGEQLVRRGGVPRATSLRGTQCHGQAMTGVNPGMPGLLGLPRDYVLAQLGAYTSTQYLSDADARAMTTILKQLPRSDAARRARAHRPMR